MTAEQFKVHWRRLENKYPKHFQNEDHRNREHADWYDNFIKLEDDITEKAFDYYFKSYADNWFPELPRMLNCYTLIHNEEAASKDLGESHGKETTGITRNFYDTIQSLKKRIDKGEVPLGFTDNKFKDGGSFANYKSVNALSECFVKMFKDTFEAPALAEHRRKKLEEPRTNRSAKEMLDGVFTMGSGGQVKQKLCYYCEQRVLKNGAFSIENHKEVFECSGCEVEYA